MNIFEEYAQKFYDKDLKAIPCKGKRPVVKNWSKISFEDKIDQYANWSIGVQTGKVSNLIIVDIDTKDKELQNKFYSVLPPIYSGKQGDKNKGKNYFFQYPSDREVASYKPQGILDILSDGSFSVMPPSPHPDYDYNYEWVGESLLDIDIDDLPVFTKEIEDDLKALIPSYIKEKQNALVNVTKSDGSRCNHGSHNYLSAVVKACVYQEIARSQAIQEVLKRDSEINESVSYFNCPSRKEFKTGDVFKNAVQFVNQAYDRSIVEGEIFAYPEEPPRVIEINFDSPAPKEFSFKNSLPVPEGHLKTLQDHIYRNSPRARKTLSLASAISTLGVVFSHKIRWGMATPNLYQVMISGSSGGKNTPLMMPKKILQETKGAQFIGESPDTRAAFLAMLQSKPKMMLCIDEINKMFTQMNNKQGHLSGIAEDLSTVYSIPLDFYSGKTTKGSGTEGACHSPHIAFLGACTEESLLSSLKIENITQGFGGRVLYMIDNSYSKKRPRMQTSQIPNDLTRFLATWNSEPVEYEKYDLTGRQIMIYGTDENLKPKLVELNEINKPIINNAFCQDESFDDEINDYYEDLVEKSQGDYITQAIYGRAHENYSKIALIHACSKLDDKNLIPHIDRQDMEFAKQYVDYCLERFLHFATVRMGESFEKKKEDQVINSIKRNFNEKEFTRTELYGKIKLSSRELNAILISLVTSGVIAITSDINTVSLSKVIQQKGTKFKLN